MPVATTPDDDALVAAILEWLPTTDYMSVTRKVLTEAMETKHNWSLGDKKEVIRGALNSFVESQMAAELEATPKKKGGGGFQKPVQLSAELAKFMKCDVAPRTEVTKEIWRYIKENKCQNPDDGREIICDAVLEPLIKRPKIHFMKMTKELAKHMYPIYDDAPDVKEEGSSSSAKKRKIAVAEASAPAKKAKDGKKAAAAAATAKKTPTKAKAAKSKAKGEEDGVEKKKGGFASMMWKLSAPLAKLLDVETESRPQVVSRLWKYIKAHELQNPDNKTQVRLDAPLQACFGVSEVTMFSINKYLGAHLERVPPAAADSA
jgi:upstream activation factor subunit UAF30